MQPKYLTLTALAMLAAAAPAAPVSITPATLTYTQNFDSLGTASVPWTNDSTLAGWYAQINNGTTATGSAQAADGTVVLSGLLNLGTAGSGDRALGSKATGTGNFANIACAVSFQNNGAKPVALSQLQYTGELWRTNTGTGDPLVPVDEEFAVFYQVSNAPVTNILSGGSSGTAAPGAGFAALGVGANWIGPVNTPLADVSGPTGSLNGNDPANRTTITFSPSSVTLLPGQYLMIKWTDANESGTDGFQGIDDLTATFVELDGVLSPSFSKATRQDPLNTPADPTDDTFGFTANVIGSGTALSTGWTTADVVPPVSNASSANYGVAVVWTGFPVSSAKTVAFSDSVTPAFNAALTVEVPRLIGTNNLVSPAGFVTTNGTAVTGWNVEEIGRTLTQNNSTQADFVVDSAPIDLSSAPAVQVTVELDAITGNSSGFEAPDRFTVQMSVDGGPFAGILGSSDTNADGYLTGAASAGTELPDATVVNFTKPFSFTGLVPASANSLVIRIIGNSNSGSETYLVKNISLNTAPPSILATAPANITRHENGPGLADDTVTFDTTLTSINAGSSWNATGATPGSGSYGAVTFSVPVTTNPAVVTVTDASFPGAIASFSIPIPARYTIGYVLNGTTLTDLYSDPATVPAPEWINDPVLHTLDMTTGGTSDKVVASDVLNLTSTGTLYFSALLLARETSNSTNFEPGDRFKAELVIDGGTPGEQILNLVTSYDVGNGASATAAATNGVNGPPDGYINGYSGTAGLDLISNITYAVAEDEYNANRSRDEFNRLGEIADISIDNNIPLTAVIPASANTVQLRIYGAGISGSEFFTVHRTIFSTVSPASDSDGDGITDLNEIADGSNPLNPASLFTVSTITLGPGGEQIASFPTFAGRSYRGYISTDLVTWTRDDSVPIITGDGGVHSWTLPNTGARAYLKVVSGISPADFLLTIP
jgi:hypothetical protein